MDGFDFGFTPEGEIIVDKDSHDIYQSMDNELKIQLSYNRIKSVSFDWFIDEIGANLEELVGRKCTEETVEYGKTKIISSLIFDKLWDNDDIFIKGEIIDNTKIKYEIFLKIYQSEEEDPISYEIEAELDLVKGVFIRYGWK